MSHVWYIPGKKQVYGMLLNLQEIQMHFYWVMLTYFEYLRPN